MNTVDQNPPKGLPDKPPPSLLTHTNAPAAFAGFAMKLYTWITGASERPLALYLAFHRICKHFPVTHNAQGSVQDFQQRFKNLVFCRLPARNLTGSLSAETMWLQQCVNPSLLPTNTDIPKQDISNCQ